jgi:hypothetical protein
LRRGKRGGRLGALLLWSRRRLRMWEGDAVSGGVTPAVGAVEM